MSFIPFSHISTQKIHNNNDISIIGSLAQVINQSFVLPLVADKQQCQITHLTNYKQINYKIHHGFTSNEEILIENALQIISDRLFKPEILENMYQICGTSGTLLHKGVWSRSQLENNNNYHGRYDLLRFQLMCLQNMKIPTIHIHPMYEENDTQSAGVIGCVSCIADGSKFSIKGQFNVKLNRYNLDAPDQLNLAISIYWAGAIVHEMLHNLGHKHTTNDYSDCWQVNVFEKCFIYNGKYSPS